MNRVLPPARGKNAPSSARPGRAKPTGPTLHIDGCAGGTAGAFTAGRVRRKVSKRQTAPRDAVELGVFTARVKIVSKSYGLTPLARKAFSFLLALGIAARQITGHVDEAIVVGRRLHSPGLVLMGFRDRGSGRSPRQHKVLRCSTDPVARSNMAQCQPLNRGRSGPQSLLELACLGKPTCGSTRRAFPELF